MLLLLLVTFVLRGIPRKPGVGAYSSVERTESNLLVWADLNRNDAKCTSPCMWNRSP